MTRTLADWFALYQQSHQNPANQRMHFLCVPLIVFSIVGLLYLVPLPGYQVQWWNVSLPTLIVALVFYLRCSWTVFLVMGFYFLMNFALLIAWYNYHPASVLPSCVGIFLLAWIGQFIGHIWEGKKPSFFQDLFFLLIGPAWVIQKLLRKLNFSLI